MRITFPPHVMLLTWASLLALAFHPGSDRTAYPQQYFGYPVDRPLRLSGTFGELRPDHFHSGIDIKGAIGHPIYAAADGYISRIGVSGSGYGYSLRITHPNGYTTLYGHLDAFGPAVARYVRSEQDRQRRFELDLQPDPDRFPVRKGMVIGEMGTSGSSFGPHLHFEIRDSKSENPINPLLFGLKVADGLAPRPRQLRVYQLGTQQRALSAQTIDLVAGEDGTYSIPGGVLSVASPQVGIALQVHDQMDGVTNRNGVYRLRMYLDDSLAYEFHMESFEFAESRFLNAHLDYEQQATSGGDFHRCYRLPGNRLSIYDVLREDGVVRLPPERPVQVRLEASDFTGNTSRISFRVKLTPAPLPEPPPFHYRLRYDRNNLIDEYRLYLYFPLGAFYEHLDLFHREWDDGSGGIFSTVHSVHDFRTPVHTAFDIGIRPTILPDELRDKAFIAYCDRGGRMVNCGGEWIDGRLQASVRALGDYCIMVDDTPPRIEPILFRKDMRRAALMTFRILDAVAGPLTFEATIDGEWVLMEYDAKNDLLIHRFGENRAPGEHRLRLAVTDRQNNTRVLEETFLR